MEVVSPDWIASLRDAARIGKSGPVLELIDQIRPVQPELAEALETLVHEFRFDRLVA